ncbi:type I restriction endonuclease subunit R [Mycoplasma buteonis]|uniref:type I restriction endonuclease subunit R n=1 Tax=Mycoplasma buteonis TaxID=171280 RepID=UPI000565E5AD|nr:type I restriction endonuclease subunit R [Mycoplasma buteonis]
MDKKVSSILQSDSFTVIGEYDFEKNKNQYTQYESESKLEERFIEKLVDCGYEYANFIKTENDLINNLRDKLEKLNKIKFTNTEWRRFFNEYISNPTNKLIQKTRQIQEIRILEFERDDKTFKNIKLIDDKNINNNYLQVINQFENTGKHKNIYDVTILVNGFPMVHIELKRRGIELKTAFNQIERYKNESFWANSGLFEYVQIFVISNGTETKYYSNTTREHQYIEIENNQKDKKAYVGSWASKTFEFTTYWTDSRNYIINDLMDFAQTFFARHTILNILTRYCVFNTDEKLLVMRPYQIVATERILNKIKYATNNKEYGTINAGGYIWHTTGSGKTLTSFKTATLAYRDNEIEKVVFVVDRSDLDSQTVDEYNRFQENSVSGNFNNTELLKKNLESKDLNSKIIVTTIQKLNNLVKNPKYNNLSVYKEKVVFIFDECHRSQFGEMHKNIINKFKNYYIFGFTGTPIFAANALISKSNVFNVTTEQVFGKCLHQYTIVDAIRDANVLPFQIKYPSVAKFNAINYKDERVNDIAKEKAYRHPERIKSLCEYILSDFDHLTKRNTEQFFKLNIKKRNEQGILVSTGQSKQIRGFNAMLATADIPSAKLYYTQLKRMLNDPNSIHALRKLKIALIYSYNPNENTENYDTDGLFDENNWSVSGLDKSSREFLEHAMGDYNQIFGTNFSTDDQSFSKYYSDVSMRMKNREIDLLIVVNMFLTGFDAPILNTLFVDKNLRMHGLIQAFSRTNRILNSIKTNGNIICFRNIEESVEKAIALFGDKEAKGIVLIKTFDEYINGFQDLHNKWQAGYKQVTSDLKFNFPIEKIFNGTYLLNKEQKKDFVRLWSQFLRINNILIGAFSDEFENYKELHAAELINEFQSQNYQSLYNQCYREFVQKIERTDINEDLEFEIGIVKYYDIDIDYILDKVQNLRKDNVKDKEIITNIDILVNSSLLFYDKKELIENFIKKYNLHSENDNIQEKFDTFVSEERAKAIEDLVLKYNGKVKIDKFRKFADNCLETKKVNTYGVELNNIIINATFPFLTSDPSLSYTKIKESIIEDLETLIKKY